LSTTATKKTLPRDDLFRGNLAGLEMRADGDSGMPTLFGYFARFNEWTEINSIFEGRFLERIADGAFKKTFREQKDDIRVLFQHGRDFQVGDKPLGPIATMREDRGEGGYYEVPLLDTSYNRDLVPGLEAGLYGASFRMRVMREEIVEEPGRSDHNPDGIPERTIKEIRLFEFGPVTFPAYKNATANVRSLTDEFVLQRFLRDPDRLRELVDHLPETFRAAPASGDAGAADTESLDARRERVRDALGDDFDEETFALYERALAPAEDQGPPDVDEDAAGDGGSETDDSSNDDAPPTEGAVREDTPDDGRRGTSKNTESNYLGSNPKEKPSWRL
jgi:HK97 family phage prohead protease